MNVVHSSRIEGTVTAPASKSVMIRAVAASLLARGTSLLANPSYCTDSLAALDIAGALGADIQRDRRAVTIRGTGGLIQNGTRDIAIHCGESGLCMRMFAPIAALSGHRFVIEGSGSLCSRPMNALLALSLIGGTCTTNRGYPPVTVGGPLTGGDVTLDGSETSQFITGVFMAAPLCKERTRVEVQNLKSKPYVTMTVDLLRQFGITIDHDDGLTRFFIDGNQRYEAQTFTVEGDWSGAAFLLVAGAIAGEVTVKGLNRDSFQADKAVIEGLIRAGASVTMSDQHVRVGRKELHAFEFDATDCPDLVPPLTALAAHCPGKSVIYGTSRLKHKESDRAKALASEFSKLSVRVDILPDRMEIHGNRPVGNSVNSHNDHRIAMSCATAALAASGPVTIEGSGCVSKSYPDFFQDLNSLQGVVQ